jgi:5-formyltetrahydrofolate cyclo-ligase
METQVIEAKAALRKEVLARVRAMSPAERQEGSERIASRLQEQPLWRDAETVLLYASLGQEVDTWPLINAALSAGKHVGLPRYHRAERIYRACEISRLSEDLIPGQLGIMEPAEHCPELMLKGLDLVVVPGVAFDWNGGRLGRGKGYYDRLLATVRGMTCGLGYDEQLVAQIPVAPHDIRLNCILTPTRWIQLTGRGPWNESVD